MNPAGLFDAENLAAIVAAAQVGGTGFELEIEIATRAGPGDQALSEWLARHRNNALNTAYAHLAAAVYG